MNKCKIFSTIALFSISSIALAAGTHGGHDNASNSHAEMKADMGMSHWASPKAESASEGHGS